MEQLLHYVWKHKLFPLKPLLTAEGESIEIIDPGQANYNAGPDCFNAKIKIGGVVWVGNIEIHQQSSEWERHGHHLDSNYDSVILHVASEIDASVRRSDGETIPQLELHCPGYLSDNYRQLIEADRYPACYRLIPALPKLLLHSWLSRLQTERFEQKTDKIIVSGAGRTDAGVHATAQVAHFDLKEDLVDWKLREAINARLREMEAPVSVIAVEKVGNDFHARFSARGRGYLYRILNRRAPAVLEKNRVWWVPVPLDVEKMREGAGYLIGHHDFSSFRAAACQAKSPVKTLDRLDIEVRGEEIHFIVEARSFLHHQVRNMVGTLKMVGDGHLHPEDVKRILEAKNRAAAGVNAPACGLYLTKVVY